MNNGGNGYNNRRNTYSQRSESNQRGENNYQRSENNQRGENNYQRRENNQRGENNYQRSENNQRGENNYQRSENYQRAENYQYGGNGQSEEEMEIPGYGQLDSGMMANGILEVIRKALALFDVKTICRERMMCMCHRRRSADSLSNITLLSSLLL